MYFPLGLKIHNNFPMNHQYYSSMMQKPKILFFLVHNFILFFNIKAQNFSDGMASQQDSVNSFEPSLAVVIGMLAIMFLLTFILLLYAKFCHTASSPNSTTAQNNHQIRDGLVRSRSRIASGIDKTVVESLPFFRFSSLRGVKEGLECSVCLAKFEDIEILRLLPKCKHAFHIDCIDKWLEKHSTCPLCRQKVGLDDVLQLSNSLRFLNQSDLREESNLEIYIEREESSNGRGSSRFNVGGSFRKLLSGRDTKEEEQPIHQHTTENDERNRSINMNPLHRLNHRIVVSDSGIAILMKNRWSNVSSSDLMFLNSEMIGDVSSSRFDSLPNDEQKKRGVVVENENEMMSIKEEMERKRVFESKMREIRNVPILPFPSVPTSTERNQVLNSNEKRCMSEIVVHPRFRNGDSSSSSILQNNTNNVVKEERMRRVWLPIARKTIQWFANRDQRRPNV